MFKEIKERYFCHHCGNTFWLDPRLTYPVKCPECGSELKDDDWMEEEDA